ncbi:MAG: mechanosensitive ion channel domain-containing protein [Thermodesulfobacteriota bacterium]
MPRSTLINQLRIVFLIILTTFFLPYPLSGFDSSPLKPADIFDLLGKIENINKKITNVTTKTKDKETKKNEKIEKNRQKLSGLINEKITIMENIPKRFIEDKIFSSFQKARFQAKLKELEVRINTNSKLNYDTAVTRDEIEIDYLLLNKQIDTFYKNIKELLHKKGNEADFLELFKKQQAKLAKIDLSKYEAAQSPENNNEIYKELTDNLAKLKSRRNSYGELLSFLSRNTMLLVPEVFHVGSLSFQNILNRINNSVSMRPLGINPGKLVISGTLLLFIALVYIIAIKASGFLLNKPLVQNEETESDQNDIIKSVHKPIGILLTLYGMESIIRIFFYPKAIAPHLLLFSDLLKLAAWVWLAMVFVKTYSKLYANQLLERKDTLRREILSLGIKISYFIIAVIAVIIGLKIMSCNISAVIASLGIGGLAMALAAKDTLANFLASITLLISNPFSLGDWIETEAAEGTVVEVGLRQTTIRTFDNSMLFVPNSMLSDKIIKNWSRRKLGRRIKSHISLPNDSNLEALEKCLKDIREMLTEHPDIANPHRSLSFSDWKLLKSRKNIVSPNDFHGYKYDTMVYVDNLGPSTIDILIYCFSTSTDWSKWLAIKEDILLKIIEIIKNNGLKLAIPAQNIRFEPLPGWGQLTAVEPSTDNETFNKSPLQGSKG